MNRKSSKIRILILLAVGGLSVLTGGCSYLPKGETDLDLGIKERGIASWYGGQFHGKTAANGEIYDMTALTAAHRTLPLGTVVRVINVLNGKQVRVRINDRGPYVGGRILDLSYAAAQELGMVEGGISVVQLEVIGDHRPEFLATPGRFVPATGLLPLSGPSLAGSRTGSPPTPSALDGKGATRQVVRFLPGDMITSSRRVRRVSDILAADHTVYAAVASLVLA
ncbi:MAG: septal ring lytic transglycosylase RlpA family protein [Nitrospirota bacterium]